MLRRLHCIVDFYVDGFHRMTLGKTLWKIIIVKLIVMFALLKLFFFPDYLNTNFDTDRQRADHVLDQLTRHTNDQIRMEGGKR